MDLRLYGDDKQYHINNIDRINSINVIVNRYTIKLPEKYAKVNSVYLEFLKIALYE